MPEINTVMEEAKKELFKKLIGREKKFEEAIGILRLHPDLINAIDNLGNPLLIRAIECCSAKKDPQKALAFFDFIVKHKDLTFTLIIPNTNETLISKIFPALNSEMKSMVREAAIDQARLLKRWDLLLELQKAGDLLHLPLLNGQHWLSLQGVAGNPDALKAILSLDARVLEIYKTKCAQIVFMGNVLTYVEADRLLDQAEAAHSQLLETDPTPEQVQQSEAMVANAKLVKGMVRDATIDKALKDDNWQILKQLEDAFDTLRLPLLNGERWLLSVTPETYPNIAQWRADKYKAATTGDLFPQSMFQSLKEYDLLKQKAENLEQQALALAHQRQANAAVAINTLKDHGLLPAQDQVQDQANDLEPSHSPAAAFN